jgi:hypothetical protein
MKEKLANVFMPDKQDVGRLVRRGDEIDTAKIALELNGQVRMLTLRRSGDLEFNPAGSPPGKPAVFIPARETLSMFDGFIAAYESQKLSFDETYYDLCVALSGKPLRNEVALPIAPILESLTKILGGQVLLEGGRFCVQDKSGQVEAHMLAEGHRKIAEVAYLIGNGSLARDGFLFWDEPEASLNPKLVTKMVQTLQALVKGGIQVFLATHDYLLSHELSLAMEYGTEHATAMRFFALGRVDGGSVAVKSGNTLAEIPSNPILDEFAAHYDRERELFNRRQQQG